MASFASHLSLHPGPAAYCLRKQLTYAMSSGAHFTKCKAVVLSLKKSQGKIPLEISGKQLRFTGWDQLTRRCGSVQIPVIKAAPAEPSSAPAEEDQHLPILLYLDWYLFSTLLRIFTRKIYIYFPFPYFVSVAQLAVGVTLCIVNSSLGSHKRAPINKDLLAVITPTAVLHTIVHLVYNNFLNSEVVRPVPLKDKVLAPFYTTVGSWILRRQDFFVSMWVALAFTVIGVVMSLTSRNFYLKEAMKRVDSTNVYTYVSVISLLFAIPFALHMEGPKVQYQLSRAIAKTGMGTILYDFLMLGVLYYRCNKVATESLRRIHPVIFTVGILFEYVCATSYSK